MPSPSSCIRCAKPLAVGSNSNLCPVCLAADDTSREPATSNTPAAPGASTVSFRLTPIPKAPAGQTRSPESSVASHLPDNTTDADFEEVYPTTPAGYELIEPLGNGGMGDVFLVRDVAADRLVAMKFLRAASNPAAVERFLTEVRALARLRHPHIVQVFAHDFYRAVPFFTMEYAPGGTLSDRITVEGPLDPTEAAKLMATVARAVAAAHAERVLHRDLKPSNVLLAEDGTPRVSDFGLAKRTDCDDGLTTISGPLGTPGYMPPEQVSPRRGEIGEAADIYGLGATLYHVLTGKPPFSGETRDEVAAKVLSAPPERVRAIRPEVPLALEAIVLKCLEKSPADRYPSAVALAEALERFPAGGDPDAPQLTRWRRLRRWAISHRQRIAAVCVAMAAVTVLVWVAVMIALREPQPPDPDETRKTLAAGRRFPLIGESGLPRWHDWRIGATRLAEAPEAEQACFFESLEEALLELHRDPGTDGYTVTADLRMLRTTAVRGGPPGAADANLPPAGGLAGLYFGYARVPMGNGLPTHAFLTLSYSDFLPPEFEYRTFSFFSFKVAIRNQATAQLRAGIIALLPGVHPYYRNTSAGRAHRFDPVERLPGDWRRLRVEVTPEGVRAFWADHPSDPPVLVVERTAAQLDRALAAAKEEFEKSHPGLSVDPPKWNPRMPLGVWCRGAAVAIRNYALEP